MKKLVILACVVAIVAIIAVTAATALGGGIINQSPVCNAMNTGNAVIGPKDSTGTYGQVYEASCTGPEVLPQVI